MYKVAINTMWIVGFNNGNVISKLGFRGQLHYPTVPRQRLNKTSANILNAANTSSPDSFFRWKQKSKHLLYLTC